MDVGFWTLFNLVNKVERIASRFRMFCASATAVSGKCLIYILSSIRIEIIFKRWWLSIRIKNLVSCSVAINLDVKDR